MSSSTLNLFSLKGNNGFVINGLNAYDNFGVSVSSAGDLNGDGLDDLIIGADRASTNRNYYAGVSYVVFGDQTVGGGGSLNLSKLDGNNGFAINGINEGGFAGRSVSSAGDLNGDGFDDMIIGAYLSNPKNVRFAGESYVIFGSSTVGKEGSLNLSTLDGSNGFTINGIKINDFSGFSVSDGGDLNGDGFDDLIIGAFGADPLLKSNAGASYVIFGSSTVGKEGSLNLSTLDGSNGFTINGINKNDYSGACVSSAGDINGDGFDDLIIGADRTSNNNVKAGASYVVFGGQSVGKGGRLNLSSLNGSNGFVINGVNAYDYAGDSVSSAGDLNGDGFDDLIIGAFGADKDGKSNVGASYVVFGGQSVGKEGSLNLSTLNGSNGFAIHGINAYDYAGDAVSGGGDINGDGFDDLIIGAFGADKDAKENTGASYVVFGGQTVGKGGSLNLSSLNSGRGLIFHGIKEDDKVGYSLSSTGDVNGDGLSDMIFGAYGVDPNSKTNAGASYVIFGNRKPVAKNDNAITIEDTAVDIDVFSNDKDDKGNVLTLSIEKTPSQGIVVVKNNGTPSILSDDFLTYTPNTNANGTDSLTYKIDDGNGGIATATVNITIQAVNDAPVAKTDNAITNEDTPVNIRVLSNDRDVDGDSLKISNFTNPGKGAVILINNGTTNTNDDFFVYTPNPDYYGTDSFTYTVSDGEGGTSKASVNVTVNPVDDELITGNNGNNRLTGNASDNTLIGLSGNDTLDGRGGDDLLRGGAGNDSLIGGLGNDTLTGGPGNDRFIFNSKSLGNDRLNDFNVIDDAIAISSSGFGGGLVAGAAIKTSQFRLGSVATTANQRFIYNATTGGLFFDLDGTGATAQTQLATLNTGLSVTNADIFVIA